MYSTPKLTGVLLITAAIAFLAGGCNSVPVQKAEDKWDNTRRAFNAKVRPSQERIESVMVEMCASVTDVPPDHLGDVAACRAAHARRAARRDSGPPQVSMATVVRPA